MNTATQKIISLDFWKSKPSVDAINGLIATGADVNARDRIGWTPLHMATSWGTVEAVTTLIAMGADVNAKSDDDWTSLHTAAWDGNVAFIHALLDARADSKARDCYGQTPYDIARNNRKLRGHTKVLKRLAA